MVQKGWTLNRSDWIELDRQFSGKKWKMAKLDDYLKSSVPPISGVYLISGGLGEFEALGKPFLGLRTVVYAGKSGNLSKRFSDHARGKTTVVQAMRIWGRLEFWFLEVDQAELATAEKRLIDTLGPPCNANGVSARIGSPRRI